MDFTAIEMANNIKNGNQIVFLTGAGISTPSGIPDYRSAKGIYTESGFKEPEYLLSKKAILHDTVDFHHFISQLCDTTAKPNIIHKKIDELGKIKNVTVITQNIDGLHTGDNYQSVEFHGSLANCYCEKCYQSVLTEDFVKSYTHEGCGES